MANEETKDLLTLRPLTIQSDADAIDLVDSIHQRLRQLNGLAAMAAESDTEYSDLWDLVGALSSQNMILLNRLSTSIRQKKV